MAENGEVTTFKKFTVTTKGLLLEAKVKAGETVFKYTRAIIGCGILPDGYNVLSMTAVIEEIPSHQTGQEGTSATVDLSRCYKMAEGVVGLAVRVKNGDKGFRLREIAIMALDPDEGEILYAYGYAGIEGEPFSAFDGKTHIIWNLTIPFVVSNFDVDKIIANITFHPEVPREEFDAHVAEEETQIADLRSRIAKRDITIPAEGWIEGDNNLHIDIPQDGVTEDMTPIISISPEHIAIAKECGMSSACETFNGGVRIYAINAPATEISASLVLLCAHCNIPGGGGSGSGADYVLPVATATRLGGVKIGNGVDVTSDGTISVDANNIIEEVAADESDVNEMLDTVYGNDKQ